MKLKDLLKTIFTYTPPVEYNFSLPESTSSTENNNDFIPNSTRKTRKRNHPHFS